MLEAYKVGVTIALTNHVSKALLGMRRDFQGTDAEAKKLQQTLNSIKKTGLAGITLGAGGYSIAKGLAAAVGPAKEYAHQINMAQEKLANLDPARRQLEMAQMTAAAWKTASEVITSTPTGNMKAVQELRMVLGSTELAAKVLPQAMRLEGLLANALHGEGGVKVKDVAFTALKGLELRGATATPELMAEEMQLVARAVIASNGRFDPAMFLQSIKYLKGGGRVTYSRDFMYGIMPTLAQEMGGSQVATALTSMERAVVDGRIDKKAMPEWVKYGFGTVTGVTGETARIKAKNADLMQVSPELYAQWMEQSLIDQGVTEPNQRRAIFGKMFSNRNAGSVTTTLATQSGRLQKDFDLTKQAAGLEAYNTLIKTDPYMADAAATAQWEKLKTAIGIVLVPPLTQAILGFANGLNTLGNWFKAHPNITKGLVYGLTALSGALMFSGAIWTLKAAFWGLKLVFGGQGLLGVLGVAKGAGLLGRVGSLATALGPLGLVAALVAAVGAVIYFRKEIRGLLTENISKPIDNAAPWIGDGLMGARDWLSQGDSLSGLPPRKAGGGSTHVTVNIDGQTAWKALAPHQEKAMSKPSSGTSFFDIGKTMAGPSASHAQ